MKNKVCWLTASFCLLGATVLMGDEGNPRPARTNTSSITAVPRATIELRGGTGYSRLVQPRLMVQNGEYEFSCLLSDDIRFQQHDHVPGLWNITPDVTRSDVLYERQADGWIKYSCTMEVPTDGTHDFIIALWGHEKVQFASLSLKQVGSGSELLQNGNFATGTSNWSTNGGTLHWHRSLLPVPPRPELSGQKVTYTTFQGKQEVLNGFEGEELILLIPDSPGYTKPQVEALLRNCSEAGNTTPTRSANFLPNGRRN